MSGRCAAVAASAVLVLTHVGSGAHASVLDPRLAGEYRAAARRAADVGKHLGASLASANPYDRLFALESVRTTPTSVGPDLAGRLAELVVDRTPLLSLHCMSCQMDCATCDGCWGSQGASDCGQLREVGGSAISAMSALATGPLRAPLADALWSIALRSDANARAVAPLMPMLGEGLRARVRGALSTVPNVAPVLRLLASFPPGQCGDAQLAATLARFSANSRPMIRGRAATAILVCGDGSPAWAEPARAAAATLGLLLHDPKSDILGELPAVAPVVGPLAAAIGRRMAIRGVADGRQGVRLLRSVPSQAIAALPGLRARLLVADDEESVDLLMLIVQIKPNSAPLNRAVIACARRNGAGYWAIAALGAMRAQLSIEDRNILKRAYRLGCGFGDDCRPFSQVMAESFANPTKKHP